MIWIIVAAVVGYYSYQSGIRAAPEYVAEQVDRREAREQADQEFWAEYEACDTPRARLCEKTFDDMDQMLRAERRSSQQSHSEMGEGR